MEGRYFALTTDKRIYFVYTLCLEEALIPYILALAKFLHNLVGYPV